MPRDVSLSDSKCWNGGHEWVKSPENPSETPRTGYPYSKILPEIHLVKANDCKHFFRHELGMSICMKCQKSMYVLNFYSIRYIVPNLLQTKISE